MSTAAVPWPRGAGLRYGMLGLPLAFCALPLYVLLPNMYARQGGVSLAALGSLLLGVRMLDAVIDPWLGRWVDRLFAISPRAVLRLGAGAALVLALGFSLLFVPVPRASVGLLWWAGVWLVVTFAAYSTLTVAHQAWGALLGGDAVYRSRVVAWREGLGLAGVLLASVTPVLFGVPAMLALWLAGLSLGSWLWWRAPRPGVSATAAVTQARWQVWHSAGFRRLLAVYMLNGIASAIPATLVLFFVQDRLQASEALASAALALYFLAAALSMPGWLRLVARLGLERSWLAGMLASLLSFMGVSLLGAGDGSWFLLLCALSGLSLGSDLALPGALLAALIHRTAGQGRASGSYFGWWNCATKLNLALAAGLCLPLLGWLGYTPGARDPHALALLTATYCGLPCALKAIAALALRFFVLPHADQPPKP